jgi:hypothetical protein
LLNSGAVFKRYKASVEISSGGRVYTKDSGSEGIADENLLKTTFKSVFTDDHYLDPAQQHCP